ncbi:MAG: sulfite exporter TauE/SafE family protein [Proteobacteria bacterium]|nr:sulfite exporter TauE/SafE family protein [Pseudomonadota bacterium]NOG61585.1 sulfite exporter TauE/SafE family protein [Pseudomonadota bacterium]
MLVTLIIAFNLGLFSTLHCIGMCGGFISTMMLASSESNNGEKKNILKSSLFYNLGRIFSYSIAGLVVGLFGFALTELLSSFNVRMVLQFLASIILIGIALNILGVLSLSKYLENSGMKLWRHIQPLTKSLLPVDSFIKAFLLGMIWGWLPCGMVYSALILSVSTGNAINGMLVMLFFGLGTLPAMLSAGYFVDYLNQFRQNKHLRWITAIVLILIAVSLPLSMQFMPVHDHQMQGEKTKGRTNLTDHSMHINQQN